MSKHRLLVKCEELGQTRWKKIAEFEGPEIPEPSEHEDQIVEIISHWAQKLWDVDNSCWISGQYKLIPSAVKRHGRYLPYDWVLEVECQPVFEVSIDV